MSTVDRVHDTVMSDMLRGALAPGSWVRQDELADRLGVSKIPVREALQRLAAIGLVRFETNRGAVVPELSAADADENYSLRRAIEGRLLQQALPRLSIVDLAAAELALTPANAVTEAKSASGSNSATAANWQFHRALYQASGWHRGLAMAEILHVAVAPYVVLYIEGLGGAADSDAEHLALLDACRARDAGRALPLLDAHLAGAASTLINFLETRSSPR